jgi:glycosyltransferase involved in cell wall biosynthesis
MEGLEKNGHHNVAVVWKGGALAQRLKGKIPLWEMRPLGEWDFIAAHQLNRQLKRERIDLLHAHSGHGAALAAFASLGTKIPVIVTRRVDFHLSGNIFSRWKYKRARRIVAISNGVKQILLQDGIPPEKISVVPSGVDFNRYTTVKAISRAELKVPSETILIGQVAALAPHKDQNNLLEAIAHL